MRVREGNVLAPAESELLDEYFAFRAASFPPGRGYVTSPPKPEDFSGERGVFLVAETDGGVAIGCAGLRRIADASDGTARVEVKHLWLRPEARGQGVAGALMDELEARARAWGAREMVLDTHHTLEAAGRLYARKGFRTIEPYNDNPNATRWYAKTLD